MDKEGFYKLEFGDVDPSDGSLVIDTVSDNKDAAKVFATVIMSAYKFTNQFRNAYLCSHSNSKARMRIYRIGINRYIQEVKKNAHLFIDKENSWEEYAPDADFVGFMIKRKENSFFNTINNN